MSIVEIKNMFSKEEIEHLHQVINSTVIPKDENGEYVVCKNSNGVDNVTYGAEYGTPNLPPHFDGDTNDLIINFQLSSNTSWPLGLDLETYNMEDNSALIFNANTNIHWRPNKVFNDGEYVQMIFFRFYKINNRTDYSYVPMNQTDKIFEDVVNLRNSL